MHHLFGDEGEHAGGNFPKVVILGRTKHVTKCQNCGREGLKETVVCARVGEDGHPTREYFYFGTDCASKIAGKSEKEVDAEADEQETKGRPRVSKPKSVKPNEGQQELALRFQAAMNEAIVERFAARHGFEELLAKAAKYREYGEHYNRNIHASASRLDEMLAQGRHEEAARWADELRLRLESLEPKPQTDLLGQPVKPAPKPKAVFDSNKGKQQSLFAGLNAKEGQMNLFADDGVPDELVAKPQPPAQKELFEAVREALVERYSAQQSPWFLRSSQLLAQKMGHAAPASQVLAMLRNNQISPEELRYTGLEQHLQSKGNQPVSQQELQAMIGKFGISERLVAKPRYKHVRGKPLILPGGTNYQELLLTLPHPEPEMLYKTGDDIRAKAKEFQNFGWSSEDIEEAAKFIDQAGSPAQGLRMQDALISRGYGFTPSQRAAGGILRSILSGHRKRVEESRKDQYRSHHWDEPNVLAHIRYQDFVGPDGKKHLHVDEIQSDWHQEGAKKGYYDPSKADRTLENMSLDQLKQILHANDRNGDFDDITQPEALEIIRRWQQDEHGVPDAPFKKSWHSLAMKRILHHAAANGYDRVTWTPGHEHAARYDLAAHVGQMVYNPEHRKLTVYDRDGSKMLHGNVVDRKFHKPGHQLHDKPLDDIIGGELTNRLLHGKPGPGGWTELSGEGLSIGGEFHKTLYDKKLPEVAHKIIKPHGGVVRQFPMHLPQAGENDGVDLGYEPARSIKVHGFDITPQMRESVIGKGQSLFSIFGDEDLAVDRYENTEPKPAIPTGQLDSHVHWEMPEFKSWFGKSKAVTPAGKPLRLFHGTKRPDRIGAEFKASRATSGPMPFFTDDPEIASSYATNKQDTSIDMPESYSQWFKYKVPGSKREVDLDNAWHHLPMEQRKLALERLPHVNTNEEGAISHKHGQGTVASDWDWYLKREGGGNPLKAARYLWLDSGHLFSDESRFLEVLKHAGIDHNQFRMESPWHEQPGVYPVWLSVQNPLDTSNIPDHVHTALHLAGRLKRGKAGDGADQWDKRHVSGPEWLERLAGDRRDGTTHAWTSIPDWVTKTLRSFGYDGIQDRGGKYSNHGHNVWIPFSPHQIKSAVGNRGTFDSGKKKIIYASEGQPERFQTPARNQHGFVSFRLGAGMQSLEGPKAPEPPKKPGHKLADAVRAAISKFKSPKPGKSEDRESYGIGSRVAEVLTERFSTPYTLRSSKLIAEKAQDNQLASQVLAMLRNNQVSQDELKWTGLEKKLTDLGDQRVNRSELQDMLSRVQLKEKLLDDTGRESWNSTGSDARYKKYATPHARNYKEMLLMWPPQHVRNEPEFQPVTTLPPHAKTKFVGVEGDPLAYWTTTVDGKQLGGPTREASEAAALAEINKFRRQVYNERLERRGKDWGYRPFTNGHYGDQDILAHIRFSERHSSHIPFEGLIRKKLDGKATPEELQALEHHAGKGGPRTLHIEEIQSDWHNHGRTHGFYDQNIDEEIRKAEAALDAHEAETEKLGGLDPNRLREHTELAYKLNQLRQTASEKVPPAPMANTITPVALRKIIHHAVQNGYDRVTWTPGWEQARRYPGGDHEVHHIDYDPSTTLAALAHVPVKKMDFHGHWIYPKGKAGMPVPEHVLDYEINRTATGGGYTHGEIAKLFGKEVADAIHAGQGKKLASGARRISLPKPVRLGHAVGLRQLYDKELPKHALKVIKPHGGEIREFHMSMMRGYPGKFDVVRDGRRHAVIDRETGQHAKTPQGNPLRGLQKAMAHHIANDEDESAQSVKVLGFDITPAMKAHYQKEGPQLFALELSNDWSGERFGWDSPQEPYDGQLEAPRESKKLTLGEKIARQLLGRRAQGVSVREAILPERKAKRHGSIIGKQLHSNPARHAEELGKLAQRYRDPRYETFRAVYLRGNEVVGVNAISHRHPSFVAVGQHASRLYEDAHRLGADKVWLVHNHPTGDATPSLPDHRTTRNFQDYFDRWNQQAKDQGLTHRVTLAGHVITNHDHFTHFGPYNGHGDHQRVSLNKPGSTMMQHVHDGVQHHRMGQVINGPDEVAQMAWNIHKNPHQAVVALVNTKHKLRALLDIDAKHLTHDDPKMGLKTLGAIRRMHRKLGTLTGFLFLPPGMKPEHINHQLRSHGAFLDMVEHGKPHSYGMSIGEQPPHDLMDIYNKAKHPIANKARSVKPESVGDKFAAEWEASVERYFVAGILRQKTGGIQAWADRQARKISDAASAINNAGERVHSRLDEFVSRPGTALGKATAAIDKTVGKLMGPKPKQLPYKPISGVQPGTTVWLNGEHKLGSGGIIPHMTRGKLVQETDEHHARVDIDGKHYHLPKQNLYYAMDPNQTKANIKQAAGQAVEAVGGAVSGAAEGLRQAAGFFTRKDLQPQDDSVPKPPVEPKKQHDSFHDRQPRPAHQVQKGDLVHIPDGNGEFVHVHANDVQVNPRTGKVKIFGNEVKFNPEAENNIEHTDHQLAIDGTEKVTAGVHRSRSFLTSRLKGKDGSVEAKDYDQDLVDALVASGLPPEQAVQRAREQAAMQGEDTPAAPAASQATPSQAPKSQQADPVPRQADGEQAPPPAPQSPTKPRTDDDLMDDWRAANPLPRYTSRGPGGLGWGAVEAWQKAYHEELAKRKASAAGHSGAPDASQTLSQLLASHSQARQDRLPIHHMPHAEFVGGDGERSGVFAINKTTGDVVLRYNGQDYPVTLNPGDLENGQLKKPKAIRNRIHQAESKKAYLAGEELPEHTRDHWEQHLPRWAREKAASQGGGVSPQGEAEAKPPLTSYAKNGPGGTGRSGAPKPQAPDFSSLPKQPPEDEPPEAPAFNPDAPENDPFSPSYVPPPETPQQQQSNRKIRVDAGVLGALREHAAGNRSGTTYVLEHAIHDMFPGSSPQVLQLLKNHVKAHHAGELNAIRQLLARKQKIQDTLPKGNTKEGRILSQKIKAGTDLHSLRNYIPNYDLIAESLSQEFPAFFAGDDRDEKVLAYLTRKDWGRQSWNDLVDRFWSDMPPQYKQDILYMSENPDAFQVIDLPDVGDNRDREQNNRWQETVPFELAAHNRLVERFSSGWQAGVPDRGKINQGPNRSKGAARGSEAATSNTKAILVERLRRR